MFSVQEVGSLTCVFCAGGGEPHVYFLCRRWGASRVFSVQEVGSLMRFQTLVQLSGDVDSDVETWKSHLLRSVLTCTSLRQV